jgi:hypothetical protein
MTGRRRASFGLARRFPLLRGPGEMALVLDAAGAVERGQRQRAVAVANLDDHAPRALVDADVRVRPPPAQASDQTGLIGCELERHAITIGTDAEALTKIRLVLAQDLVKRT